jgi:hypothetical protein
MSFALDPAKEPALTAPSCASCSFARPLHFAVYCALDEHVRNLPASFGYFLKEPKVQQVPPAWCPLHTA